MSRRSDPAAGDLVQYLTPLPPEISLDFSIQGAEWESHLESALSEELGFTGWEGGTEPPSPAIPFHHVYFAPKGAVVPGTLVMIQLDVDKLALMLSTPEVPNESDVQVWQRAIERATAAVGKTSFTSTWTAVISYGGRFQVQELRTAGTIGELQLNPVGTPYTLARPPSHHPSISSYEVRTSYPVLVRGSSTGYDLTSAMREAGRTLYQLTCLLTCAWGGLWEVLDSPRPSAWGERTVPRTPPWYDRPSDDEEIQRAEVTITPEMGQAWDRLRRDSIVMNAAAAFKEASLLRYGHASFALVAYVASIEGIGQKFNKPERCSKCRNVLASTSRFRQAAESVGSQEDTELISKIIPDLRGTTAHRGELHGAETLVGASWYLGSFFQVDPTLTFDRYLFAIHRIARNLLLDQLGLRSSP